MFEILEHTADLGFCARGRTLEELFAESAEALVAIALETEGIRPVSEYPLEASGADLEAVLVNWLSEVLYWMDGERVAFHHFRIYETGPGAVRGSGFGEPLDPARHRARLVVKGVTYHQLEVRQDPDGWSARVYLDI